MITLHITHESTFESVTIRIKDELFKLIYTKGNFFSAIWCEVHTYMMNGRTRYFKKRQIAKIYDKLGLFDDYQIYIPRLSYHLDRLNIPFTTIKY